MRLVLAPERWRSFYTHIFDLLVVALPILRPLRLLRLVTIVPVLHRTAGTLLRGDVLYARARPRCWATRRRWRSSMPSVTTGRSPTSTRSVVGLRHGDNGRITATTSPSPASVDVVGGRGHDRRHRPDQDVDSDRRILIIEQVSKADEKEIEQVPESDVNDSAEIAALRVQVCPRSQRPRARRSRAPRAEHRGGSKRAATRRMTARSQEFALSAGLS